jgi:RND family efflux transporter MFP subunit
VTDDEMTRTARAPLQAHPCIASLLTRRVGVAATLAMLLIACAKNEAASGGAEEDDGGESKSTPIVHARIERVTSAPFTETIDAIGVVMPRAGHVATLAAPGAARVARVLVNQGDHVRAGAALVVLDQAPFCAALQSAQTALTAAQRAYDRNDRLAREGVVPRKDAESAATDLARARADVAAAQRDAQLAVLRTPIAGIVTQLSATLGAQVDASAPLVEIADPRALDVVVTVTPENAGRVRSGAIVRLSGGQTAGGESLGVGSVAEVSGTVDSVSRGVSVRVRATAARRPLRIGETIYGRIVVAEHAGALAVPVAALVPDGEGFKVFVVSASGIAQGRPVKVGARTSTAVEITEGLAAGEQVVTYGAYGIDDSVKVVPLAADSTPASPPKP